MPCPNQERGTVAQKISGASRRRTLRTRDPGCAQCLRIVKLYVGRAEVRSVLCSAPGVGIRAARQAAATHEVGIDLAGSLAVFPDGPNHQGGSACRVAAGEHPWHGRPKPVVCREPALVVRREPELGLPWAL